MRKPLLLSSAAVCLLSLAVRVAAQQPKETAPLPAGAILQLAHEGPVHCLAYSPDGKALATAAEGRVTLWDSATGRQLWQLNLRDPLKPRSLAIAPDGKTLVGCGNFGFLTCWDSATGKETWSSKAPPESSWWELAFSPDGKYLATGGEAGEVSLWDGQNGKHLRRLPGVRTRIDQLSFAPDGKTLAVSSFNNFKISLWDPAAGKLLREFQDDGNALEKATLSPGGKYLAARTNGLAVRLWDWETRKELRTIAGAKQGVSVYTFAFSPDGHTIAVSQWNVHTILLYETATGLERARFTGHTDRLSGLAFAPHGRALASASVDQSVYVWDVTGRSQDGKRPAPKLSDAELARLWSDLGSEQADRAYRAIWTLARSPEQSVPFLGGKFFGAGPSYKELAGLIADLDNDSPAIREKAVAALKRRQAQARLKLLLDPKLARPEPQANRLQLLRGLEVLELSASPLARRILEDLTAPIWDEWIAQEARAALKRLGR